MLLFKLFYRKYGVRRPEMLARPRLSSIMDLNLPRSSLLHYLPEAPGKIGPDNDYLLFRHIQRPIFLQHTVQLTSNEGNPILKDTAIAEAISSYHQRHVQYKRVRTIDFLRNDPISHLVVGYGVLDRRYRYLANVMRPYNVWLNKTATLLDRANELAEELPLRNQFIYITLPQNLPVYSQYLRHQGYTVQRTLKDFDSNDKLMLLHLWRFFSEHRDKSVFNRISPTNLDKINLIFVDSGRWYVMNLGRINSLRKPTKEELADLKDQVELESNEGNKPLHAYYDRMRLSSGMAPVQISKLMIAGWMALLAQRNQAIILEGSAREVTSDQFGSDEDESVDDSTQDPGDQDNKGSFDLTADSDVNDLPDARGPNVDLDDDDEDWSAEDNADEIDELLKAVEEDITQAEDIATRTGDGTDPETGEPEPEPEPKPVDRSYQAGFMEIADSYAEAGMLSPAQYRRLKELSTAYLDLTMPDGTPLAEFMEIPPESLVIEDPPTNPQAAGMFDVVYTTSTLEVFDKQYVDNTMERDVVNMVMAIQRAGFAVKEYNVEEVKNLQSHYRSYSVVVVGMDGATQTLRFQIPVVDRNGAYRVNGVKYFTPKQQGFHLPIKKITDTRVSLTSYYGKLFVFKPRIRVANYEVWLANTIRRYASMDTLNTKIEQVVLMNVYVPRPELPRTFTALSKNFRSFTFTTPEGVTWNLDFEFTAEKYRGMEGSVVIGTNGEQQLVMAKDNSIKAIASTGEVMATYTGIEDFLDLDTRRMPVEYAAITLMGKEIPVGFIIAFRMGLKRFLHHFGITHRYVLAGERNNLGPTEYALSFADKTLILDKANVSDALLVGGFTKYRRSLVKYNIDDFDRQDIYLNVLEDNEISARFINEITLLYRMFVDPITEEILRDMNEPTTFEGLLPRAVQLLRTDHIPVVKDRIRGYERFPGAVYTEIIRSLRVQGSQAGRSRNPLDFNPYAVHRAIMGDSAKMQVDDINPIEDLRQQESLKYGGTGGRSSDTMMADDRAYEEEDQGLVSEAGVDSKNVAANAYMSFNPKINSVRGTYDNFDPETDDVSRLISTTMVVSPGIDTDDN